MKRKNKIVICIAGLTSCGKSTVARKLAREYGLKHVSGGDVLKRLAIKMGYRPSRVGWWEIGDGKKFFELRLVNPEFDRKVDEELIKLAKKGNVILDSWTMPWLFDGGFKIWLDASEEVRARRLARRDRISVREALKILREKDEKTREIYEKIYGFSIGRDFSPFNLILDTTHLTAEETHQTLRIILDRLLFNTYIEAQH